LVGLEELLAMATVSGGGDVPTVESSDGEQVSRTVAAQIQQ
jgi:hypothetical protein